MMALFLNKVMFFAPPPPQKKKKKKKKMKSWIYPWNCLGKSAPCYYMYVCRLLQGKKDKQTHQQATTKKNWSPKAMELGLGVGDKIISNIQKLPPPLFLATWSEMTLCLLFWNVLIFCPSKCYFFAPDGT